VLFCMTTGLASRPSGPVLGHVVDTGTGWAGEAFYFELDQTIDQSCGNVTRAAISPTLAQYKENVSLAMYALSSGRQVGVYYNGCFTGGSAANFVSMTVYNHY
jgi:hypothetical protein